MTNSVATTQERLEGVEDLVCSLCDQKVTLERNSQGETQVRPHKLRNSFIYCDSLHRRGLDILTPESRAKVFGTTSLIKEEEKAAEIASTTPTPTTEVDDSIQERFEKFHRDNPIVLEVLVERSRLLRSQGFDRYSMSALWEWMRWHERLTTNTSEPFKVSNDFRSRYARLIMDAVPELDGFFEIRGLTAK